jgi:predicted ATPase/DNA-binding SARP family transcriptional activator
VAVDLILLSRCAYGDREIAGARLGGLLALLAEDLRTGCSTNRLVEGLWADALPEHPTRALQVLVSRARAQLGSDIIASTPVGYRLTLSEEQVDAAAVQVYASAAARSSQAGDHAGALAQAEAGLALWDGVPSGQVVLGDPLAELRANRAATYRALVRIRALALSRLDRRAEAAGVLGELIRENSRDEEILAQLLQHEAATLGPSAALARYDAHRRSLRDELGSDPGAELLRVYRQLLERDRPVVRRGIPHEPNALLGRDADIAAVQELLRASRVVSIIGPGGLGKTRMANAVAGGVKQRIVHLIALAGVSADADVVGEVASALGAAAADAVAGILKALGSGPALLVLDNCEQVIDGVIELVRELVARSAELRVLTTSRTPLGLSSESVYLLPELSLATSIELFRQRANSARSGVDLSEDAVRDLCRRLDGLPLAVELAAARVRVMSVPEIARRLDDRFTLLRGAARDAPERHRTLHAVIDWSWNLLAPDGQAAMRVLSIFPSGFTADAAAQMLSVDDALDVLEQLVDQSLLQAVDAGSGTRFRMLETVREFSAARRRETDESEQVIDRFLAWAREFGLAHHESILGTDVVTSAARTRDEQENLLLALRFGLEREDGTSVAAAYAVLGALWMFETDFPRMAMLTGQSAGLLSRLRPEPAYVEVCRTAAVLAAVSALILQHPAAARALVGLRRLPSAPPDTPARAIGVVLLAVAEAGDDLLATLQLLCESDEPMLAAMANTVAGFVWQSVNDPDSALKAARRTLAALDEQDLQYPSFRIMTHSRIGELCLDLGRGDEAHEHFAATLSILDELPGLNAFENGSSAARIRLAMVLANLQRGAIDEAEYWLDETLRVDGTEIAGLPLFDVAMRAQILLAHGEIDEGLRLSRQASESLREPRNRDRAEPFQRSWTLEIEAMTVIAHAYHGRLHLVGQLVGRFPRTASALLLETVNASPASYADTPVIGTMLLAVAVLDIDRGQRSGDARATESGVRMIALAESFGFKSGFEPTMSVERLRALAEKADGPAYTEAVSAYTGLDSAELRAAASAAVLARDHLTEPHHA